MSEEPSHQRAGAATESAAPAVHVRFAGQSHTVAQSAVGLAVGANARVKSALANHLKVHVSELYGHVIDRHADGDLTLRPEAVLA